MRHDASGMSMRHDASGSDSTSEEESDAPSNSEESGIEALTAPRQQAQAMQRRESNFSPPSNSSDSSESESGSGTSSKTHSSPSGSEYSAQNHARKPNSRQRGRILENDSDSEPDAPSPRPKLASSVPTSTSVYDFPSVDSDPRATSVYDFCPPRRRAAANVNYAESDDSDSDSRPHPRARRRWRKGSDSEFEASFSERSPTPSESSSNEVSSEEEYLPRGRRKGRSKRKPRKLWEDDPEVCGVWRSGRARKMTSRYAGGYSDDSDYMPAGKNRRASRRAPSSRRNDQYDSADSQGSDFDPGGGAQRRKPRPSDYVRMTSRKKGTISYKESSGSELTDSDMVVERGEGAPAEEDNREGIEKVLMKRMGRVGDIGNKTTCYAKQEGDSPNKPGGAGEATEVQYLVKWRNWSYLHNTWETEESLLRQNVKGLKRFYNYLKREEERAVWEREANPEDIEFVKCQEELNDQLLEQFTLVERVIGARDSDEGSQEYLCKWRGLPYSECTWEDGALVSERFQHQIDDFLERHNSDCIPNRNARVLRHRPKFSAMRAQLPTLGSPGLRLRDYQLDGVNWLVHSWCKNNSVILADEMGLGKTIQTIGFLHCLYHEHGLYGPFLLVVPLSTMPAWQREFEQWAPEVNLVVYIGDVSSRDKIREHEWAHANRKLKFNAILTTYEILLKDKAFLGAIGWAVLVVDEAHRLKNDDSLLNRTLMEFRTNHRLLVTGTPLQNSLKELWSLLHFIMEKRFPSWEEFEAEHKAYGEGDASSLSSLHQQLQPFLLRRVKKDVEKSLPAKVEQILRVDMSLAQKQYYRWILGRNYKALSKGVKGSITGFINIVMELKKCCNHTWVVRTPDEGEAEGEDKLQSLVRGSGKLYLLDKLLVRLKETGHRVLIFSQMVRMLDILEEYMKLRRFHFQRLDGSIRGDQRTEAIDHFNSESSHDFCFLLSTRAGGLGVNLATADTVVIFDSDWNPQNDLQAQARAHRIGQTKQVNIYRLVTKGSIEEEIVERAKKKMVLDHLVIQRMDTTGRTVLSQSTEPSRSIPFDKEELTAILQFGVEELFKEGESAGDKELQEMDIDDILKRAETQTAMEDTSAANELLSQFNVASFALDEEELGGDPAPLATPTSLEGKSVLLSPAFPEPPVKVEKMWDDIIPEKFRQKLEEEERTREQLQLYLPPRQRTVQNYCEDSPSKQAARGRAQKARAGRRRGEPPPPRADEDGRDTMVTKTVRGFSDNEIRRFVKSYRRFPNPKSRLEDIAADAELQEKSLSELGRLAAILHDGCLQAEAQHRARESVDQKANPQRDKGAMLRLSGVTIGAGPILRREEELQALATCIPDSEAARKRYRMVTRAKPVTWGGVRWTAVDDAKLLVGVYEHGMGNWELIRGNPSLGLSNKIMRPEKSQKPQASHLQTRVEYLLKLLADEARQKGKKTKASKTHPPSRKKAATVNSRSRKIPKYFPPEKKPSSHSTSSAASLTVNIPRELVELDSQPSTPEKGRGGARKRPTPSKPRQSPAKKAKTTGNARQDAKSAGARGGGRRGKVVNSSREAQAEEEGCSEIELDDQTFQKCKSLLRPVKKCLNDLSPPEDSSTQDVLEHYKKVIVEIGDHINACLAECVSEEEGAELRANLWVFVSKFTPATPQKLHKVYRKTKRETEKHQAMMPVKKRYLEAVSHDQHQHRSHSNSATAKDSHLHREHYDPGYRDRNSQGWSRKRPSSPHHHHRPESPSQPDAKRTKH